MKRIACAFLYLLSIPVALSGESPKCHVYVDGAGIVSNVDAFIRVVYSSSNLCEETLKNYVCYSYFEDRPGCTRDDASLIELFKKDAIRDGRIIE